MSPPLGARLLLGLPVAAQPWGGEPRAVVDLARRAEAAGADGVVIADHVVMGPNVDRYPWGRFPFAAEAPWLEALTVLAAAAAVTERITLTTGVLIAPLRPAPLLAKTAATIDQLSGGRLELGVGTGWQEEELAAHGVDHARRGQVLTDVIGACRALWGPGPASFRSATVSFDDLWCEPRPVREGGPPVLFSGTLTARNRRRIVELGDGWIPIMGETTAGIASGVATLSEALAAAGRDPEALIVRAPLALRREAESLSLEQTLGRADELVAAGATDVSLPITPFAKDEAGLDAFFAALAAALRPG